MAARPGHNGHRAGGSREGDAGAGAKDGVDGSGRRGFTVTIFENPTFSLEGDVAARRFILDGPDEPAVLVGHSYGSVAISETGTHEAGSSLVYIAAFAPDKGESVRALIADPPPRR